MIFSVQYLRAIAAVSVVVSHQLGGLSALGAGAHGVDLFFVISGFIIFSLTEEQAVGPRRFMLDRLARIAPLYWLATLLAFVVVGLKLPLYGCSSDPVLLLKSLLFVPAYSPNGHLWPTLLLGWTLNYEMVFYLLFAVFLCLPARFRIPALAVTLLPIVLLGRILPHHGAIAATYTNPLQVEFLAGALLGSVFGISLRNNRLPSQVLYSLAVAVAMLALALVFHDLVYAAGCVVIVSAGLVVERQGWLPRSRALKFLGDASLRHLPVPAVRLRRDRRPVPRPGGASPPPARPRAAAAAEHRRRGRPGRTGLRFPRAAAAQDRAPPPEPGPPHAHTAERRRRRGLSLRLPSGLVT